MDRSALRAHNEDMTRVWVAFAERTRRFMRSIRGWRRRPQRPEAGVREPRRPKPTLPSAAVALAEPRTMRSIRLRGIIRRREG
jgi:hypothetical protein